MLVPIKTQAERLNVLPAFIYVEREPDFVLAAVDQARAVSHAAPTANRVQNIPTPAASVEWICPACGGSNTGKFCEYCGPPRP